MNEPCKDCLSAAVRAHHGFVANCPGCIARTLARSPAFHRVKEAGALDREYRGLIARFGLAHEAIKAASEADALGKERA